MQPHARFSRSAPPRVEQISIVCIVILPGELVLCRPDTYRKAYTQVEGATPGLSISSKNLDSSHNSNGACVLNDLIKCSFIGSAVSEKSSQSRRLIARAELSERLVVSVGLDCSCRVNMPRPAVISVDKGAVEIWSFEIVHSSNHGSLYCQGIIVSGISASIGASTGVRDFNTSSSKATLSPNKVQGHTQSQ